MAKVKCTCVQQANGPDVSKNVENAVGLIKQAADQGAQIICLQELFNTQYWCDEFNDKYYSLAETIPGPSTDEISKAAQETGTVIITPLYEKTIPGENYNSAAVIGPNGDIIGKYRKMSIPRINFEGFAGDEKLYFKPGNLGFPVFDTPFGVKIGILICYDRHFPEAARALALGGAEIMFVPTATGVKALPLLLAEQKGHAIANLMYVGLANTTGPTVGGIPFGGNSFFLDPMGEVLAQASEKSGEIVCADIDTAKVSELRNSWGFFRDRRPDAYGALVK